MIGKIYLKFISTYAAIIFLFSGHVMADTWTTFDIDGARFTELSGIWENKFIGYSWSGGSDGRAYESSFFYDGLYLHDLKVPGSYRTWACGISGNNIVGTYNTSVYDGWRETRSFLYNTTYNTWTTLAYPGAGTTWVSGIDGDNIVGSYLDTNGSYHGYIYNKGTWTTLDMPGAISGTYINGISGNNIVGGSIDQAYGFFYNGENWITLNAPGSIRTVIKGISGNNIIGYYNNSIVDCGFLYDGTNWSTLNFLPGTPNGIYGNTIVGTYYTSVPDQYYGFSHGFFYTIPEPTTLLLVCLGSMLIRRKMY
jgi:hypothetical protein